MRVILLSAIVLVSACADVEYLFNESVETVEVQRDTLSDSTTFQDTYDSAKDGVKRDTLPIRSRIAAFLYPEYADELQKQKLATESAVVSTKTYCYKTIADVNCYKTPQLGQQYRRVGSNVD